MSDHSAKDSQENQSSEQTNQLSSKMIANALKINAQAQETMSFSYHWQPGKQLDQGRYTISSQLGSGGMGITYLVTNRLGVYHVIKTLNQDHIPQEKWNEFQEKFRQEAKCIRDCNHSNIVKVIELFEEENFPCIVMEYVQGKSLKNLVQENQFSESEALHYILQIGGALISIHQRGIIHRDVKPDNIMIRENSQDAILIDFGIARQFSPNQTIPMTGFYTPGYAPLEQIRGQKQGTYTDVYGLAATLYFLLTGQIPNLNIPPKIINDNISDKVNNAILQGIVDEPQKRTQSVQEWLDLFPTNLSQSNLVEKPTTTTLTELSSSEIIIKPVPPSYPFEFLRRKSFLLLSLIGVIVIASGGIVFKLFFANPQPPIVFPQPVTYNSKYRFSLQHTKDWNSSGDQPIDDFNFIATEFTNIADPKTKITVEIQSLSQSQSLEDIKAVSLKEIQGDKSKIKISKRTLANLPAYQLDYLLNDTTGVLKKMEIGTIHNNQAFRITYEAEANQYVKFKKSAEEIINSLKFSN